MLSKQLALYPLNRNAISNTSLAPSSSYQVTDYLPDSSNNVDPLNCEGESIVEMLGTNVQDESAHCLILEILPYHPLSLLLPHQLLVPYQ